ncbi:class I adenylate-forming enzyme family protein [Bradyrhizobium iriomotense]|uniref:class I adenylate-forming enzyme family protein n=1 Tax=Bradyrhizobium iriomotense TaxID=441950 RepID=UPI001FE72C1D|nr:AMP-binding protein [Bradyrhizobium iriomotense]
MHSIGIGPTSARVYKSTPPHLGAVFERGQSWPDREYLVYDGERLTFGRHRQMVRRLAQELLGSYGLKKGDRIAIAMRNLPEWSVAFWAAVTIGAIAVPLNAWWTGVELSYGLDDCGARVVILDAERYSRLRTFIPKNKISAIIVARGAETTPEVRTFASIVDRNDDAEADWPSAVDIHPDDPATIFYTSGTTGRAKGALSSHRAVCTFLSNVSIARARTVLREGATLQQLSQMSAGQSTALLAVPLFHVIGCYAHLVAAMASGGKIVLMYKWDANQALELVEREKVNSFTGVPTIVLQALASAQQSGRDLSSLQAIGFSGAPAPPELPSQIGNVLPRSIPGNGYGLTESSGLISAVWGRDYLSHPGSVGYPLPAVDVKVVDPESSQTVATGQVGEIWVSSAGVIQGYWNNPEASAAAITEGWLKTGDLGRFDTDGFLYIVDRTKDIIIRGGENVYSIEIEHSLLSHPDVLEAAVIGLSHPELGEEVAAVVQVRSDARTTEEDLISYALENLARFKVPSKIQIRRQPLPRNAAGKVLKGELRDDLSSSK